MNAPALPSLTPAQVAALLCAPPDAVSLLGAVSWLGAGSDHRAYALGQDRVVRLPRWPGGGEALRREARLLAWLAPGCPARRCRRCCTWVTRRPWPRRASAWRGG